MDNKKYKSVERDEFSLIERLEREDFILMIVLTFAIICILIVMAVQSIQERGEISKVTDAEPQVLEVESVENSYEQIKVSGGGKEVIFLVEGNYNTFTVSSGDIIEYKEHPNKEENEEYEEYNRITKVISKGD